MSATTRENVIAIAPHLASIAIDTFDLILADAAVEVDSAYGTQQERGQRYFAAHLLTMIQRRGNADTLWDKVGDVEKRFNAGAMLTDSGLGETSYGREFKRIRDSVVIPFDVVPMVAIL